MAKLPGGRPYEKAGNYGFTDNGWLIRRPIYVWTDPSPLTPVQDKGKVTKGVMDALQEIIHTLPKNVEGYEGKYGERTAYVTGAIAT